VELSGIEKSSLKTTMKRINHIGSLVMQKYGWDFKPKIENSFFNILGSVQKNYSGKVKFKANQKYQSHILKVLPQIYSKNYYRDDILLPAFIEKVEFSIRSGDPKYHSLKYNLEFLLSIQNNQNNRYMQITDSKSYQAGLLLGSLSKDLKNKINSFEKNYAGNLTRRISTLSDCRKFKNDIEEKNILHDISRYKRGISGTLSELLRDMDESDYDKEQVAFGFFESYFKYETKKSFQEKLEKLLADSSNDDDTVLINQVKLVVENYKNQ